MRDHHSGPEYDSRTLRDLSYHRVRVVCTSCRHVAYLRPLDLARYQPPRWNWRLIVGRFRCTMCGKKQVEAVAEKLPRG